MIRSIKASTSLLRATTFLSRPSLPSLQLRRQSTPLNYYFSSTSTSFNAPAISSSSSTPELPPLRVESIVIPPTTQATKKEKVSRIIKARKAAITLVRFLPLLPSFVHPLISDHDAISDTHCSNAYSSTTPLSYTALDQNRSTE